MAFGENAWQSYTTKDVVYRKYYRDVKWTTYTNYNTEEYSTLKSDISGLLEDVKELELSSESKTTYTLKGKNAKKDALWKSVTITINKKSGLITKIKYTYNTKTMNYLGSNSTFTITGGSRTYSYISYCDSSITLPDELQGK